MVKLLVAALVIWGAWRLLRPAPRPRPSPSPSAAEREAAALLGIAPGAGAQAIRDAHRTRVAAVHPDRGGSEPLTRELNAARDLLLRGR